MDLYQAYLQVLLKPFIKLCRLRFLNPDGSLAFAVGSGETLLAQQHDMRTFISDGNLSVNFQNGQRRTATVTLSDIDDEFEYRVNNLWFGTEIALDEGLILPSGQEYYLQQGIFLPTNPNESFAAGKSLISYQLADKWANLDGTLSGNLEGTYEVEEGTMIFNPIIALLAEDRGNGTPIDNIAPIFTTYYNDKYQTLSDGTTVSLLSCPYTIDVEGESSKADVILKLMEIINGLVGYDSSGALRVDASQDDIDDVVKPTLWTFSRDEATLLETSYTGVPQDVYNDYIVVGEQIDDYEQPAARAQNYDPSSDTNINLIGHKIKRETAAGFATNVQCRDLAVWRLKRAAIMKKTVSISCSQILHIRENCVVEIIRTDKVDSPIERHLVQGFSRPLIGTGTMTINAVSVHDIPDITVTTIDGIIDENQT